jgi:DNA-binding NtrC family response regulator
MRILIVENELYLAQSIMSKLEELGFISIVCGSVNEALSKDDVDVILLSTNISGQNFYPVIEKFSDKIIILLVSYVSQDTVGNPIKAGAKDYILKPFMIDELVRKIRLFECIKKMNIETTSFKEYLSYHLRDVDIPIIDKKNPLPLMIKTNLQKAADSFAFYHGESQKVPVFLLDLSKSNWRKKFESFNEEVSLMYAIGFEKLKSSEKKEFIAKIEDKRALFSTTDSDDEFYNTVEINSQKSSISSDEILSVDEYLKAIILQYQDRFPDTELSKKLGMSRKSLWEKRKKYGIEKKK